MPDLRQPGVAENLAGESCGSLVSAGTVVETAGRTMRSLPTQVFFVEATAEGGTAGASRGRRWRGEILILVRHRSHLRLAPHALPQAPYQLWPAPCNEQRTRGEQPRRIAIGWLQLIGLGER
jgi:hypothetical protein